MEVYLEIEDVKYGRMIAELFENLSEGCLYELLNHKRESLEQARTIGRSELLGCMIQLLMKKPSC